MTHPSDDDLLKLTLQVLDEPEERELRLHLFHCEECRVRMEEMQNDVSSLGEVHVAMPADYPPLVRRETFLFLRSLLRIAAALIIGFFGGLAATHFVSTERPDILPMPQAVLSSPLTLPASAPGDALSTWR